MSDGQLGLQLLTQLLYCYFTRTGFSFGHVGDGNFHSVITYNEKDIEEVEKVFLVVKKIAE